MQRIDGTSFGLHRAFARVELGSIIQTCSSCRMLQLAAKPRLLVCAPSNAAADELLQRVMTGGFIGNDGNVYFPNVVRYVRYSHALLSGNQVRQFAVFSVSLVCRSFCGCIAELSSLSDMGKSRGLKAYFSAC